MTEVRNHQFGANVLAVLDGVLVLHAYVGSLLNHFRLLFHLFCSRPAGVAAEMPGVPGPATAAWQFRCSNTVGSPSRPLESREVDFCEDTTSTHPSEVRRRSRWR